MHVLHSVITLHYYLNLMCTFNVQYVYCIMCIIHTMHFCGTFKYDLIYILRIQILYITLYPELYNYN